MNPQLTILQRSGKKSEKLSNLLHLTNKFSPSLFTQNGASEYNIPTFPALNLWSMYRNTIVYTEFFNANILKNLYTNHKTIFWPHEINWHIESLNFEITHWALNNATILIANNDYHAKKIYEVSGRVPDIITNIKLEDKINECLNKNS